MSMQFEKAAHLTTHHDQYSSLLFKYYGLYGAALDLQQENNTQNDNANR